MRRFLLALPFLAALAAPAYAKDELVIGSAQFAPSLHPNIDPTVIKTYALAFAQRQVSAYDKDWRPVCLLCAELPSLENGLARIEDLPDGKKGMAVTIKLKPGLQWGDGRPVTARDIAFTLKLAQNPDAGFSNPYPWDRAVSADVVDDATAVLHLPRVLADFMMWDQVVPEHLEGPVAAAAAKGPGDYINATQYNRAPATPGLWNGPWMVTGYQSGAQVVFEPNPHWPGPKPAFRKVTLRTIENTAALQANLLSGDIDMVAGEGVGLTIDQALALRKQAPDRFVYAFQPSLTYEHIDLKLDSPILSDVRVRRALLSALDRQTLVTRLFEGLQPVAATWVNPLHPMHDRTIAAAKFDLPGAKKLLADAGWTPGPDGVCRKNGQRLSVEFGTTAGNRLRELEQQVLQNQWKAACIEATIKNEPARTLFGETLKKRTYTGAVLYGWNSTVSESPRRTLGTDQIPSQANNYGGANYPGFSDPAMDAGIAQAESELDPEKASTGWAAMQRIYAEQLPALPLFFRAEPHITPKWLRGYQPLGNGYNVGIFAEQWTSQ